MDYILRVALLCVILTGCGLFPPQSQWAHAAAAAPASGTPKIEMPVRMVVLFSSGVGYFEHSGTAQGNAFTELLFRSGQINDILKSLVLEDLDGGKIGTIEYPSQDPVEKTLRSFQVDITSNPPLADLLNQLRGSPVSVTAHAEQVEGTILGVEKRRKMLPGQNNQVVDEWVLNLLSGAVMRSLWLDGVQKIEMREPELQRDLHKALSALSKARNQDKKPVVINFQGEGNRRVRLRYILETPIWKTSYRLVLPRDKGAQSKLQGWAIVENQTDSDWNNVQLSLVSGRPVSFIEDLYKPIYLARPVVEPELYRGLRPRSYDSGIAASPSPAPPSDQLRSMARIPEMARERTDQRFGKSMRTGGAIEEEAAEGQDLMAAAPFDPTSSIVSAASAEKLGELFQYTVGSVSLPRLRSAMFPILNEDIAVERVSIFNSEVMPRNPLRGALLRNSTDKHVTQGPVTIFDGNVYAGDARIGNLPPGQERLLSYALDLEMQIDAAKNRQENTIQSAGIAKGVLNISRKDVLSLEYVIQNKADADRTLIIEHRFRPGWKLAGPQPLETTGTHYRLKKSIPKGKTETVTVIEENVRGETISILPADIGPLEVYSRSGQIPKSVRESLAKAVELKRGLADLERRLGSKRQSLEDIHGEQDRIRSNMGTVNNSSQYYSRLLEKLNAQETEIEKIQAEIGELEKKRDTQRQQLENYLAGLSVG